MFSAQETIETGDDSFVSGFSFRVWCSRICSCRKPRGAITRRIFQQFRHNCLKQRCLKTDGFWKCVRPS